MMTCSLDQGLIKKTIECDTCGEMTMESRVRLLDGKHMCAPCFQKVEQKI